MADSTYRRERRYRWLRAQNGWLDTVRSSEMTAAAWYKEMTMADCTYRKERRYRWLRAQNGWQDTVRSSEITAAA